MIFGAHKYYGAAMKRAMIVVLALALAGCDSASLVDGSCRDLLAMSATRADTMVSLTTKAGSKYSTCLQQFETWDSSTYRRLMSALSTPRADGGR